MGTGELNAGGNLVIDIPSRGEKKYTGLVTSCYRNQDKLRSGGPLDFIYLKVTVQLKNH